MILVYHPLLPRLRDGRLVTKDPYRKEVGEFLRVAGEAGLEVLNLTDAFLAFPGRTGRLPHGFPNTFPGEGHWNRDGHDLVAREVLQYLRENPRPPTQRKNAGNH
jgi:hypothetical protein